MAVQSLLWFVVVVRSLGHASVCMAIVSYVLTDLYALLSVAVSEYLISMSTDSRGAEQKVWGGYS